MLFQADTLLVFLALTSRAFSERKTAALLIGGYDSKTQTPDGPTLKSVELFGCKGQEGSIQVADFPTGIYLGGSILQQDGQVIVCGGYRCQGTICGISKDCQTWNAASNTWSNSASLNSTRCTFIMARAPNISVPEDTTKNLLVLGYHTASEMFNADHDKWVEYLQVSSNQWYGLGCLFQESEGDHAIYHVRNKVERLDVTDWSFTDLGTVPGALIAPGLCSPVTIDGQRGILTRLGSFFNLSNRQWEKKAFPPTPPLAVLPNAMFTFRGLPTIFGLPSCDAIGNCDNLEVIQYVPEKDKWTSLGYMLRPRTYMTMVEVPGEFCDHFILPVSME